MAERLQKVMAQAGVASRRASEKMILDGQVKVNGKVVTQLGTKVTGNDAVEVNGKLIEQAETKEYFLFYKPRGVISAAKDNKGRKVVTDYFSDIPVRLYPVGRLDYDTSGLLIMTNDGKLANMLMHPRYKIEKTYVAKVKGIPTNDDLKHLRLGVKLDAKHKSAPAKAKILSSDKRSDTAIVSLTIHEGRYHQVKLMLEKVGHPVKKLKREKYGFLTLDGLTEGQFRPLSHNEIRNLEKLVEGKRF